MRPDDLQAPERAKARPVSETDASANAGSVVTDRRGPRMPDFFIAGHQKCGTTALYRMLSEHPQIYMPEFKEPRFFAPELRPPLDRETPDRPQKLERYLALFADATPQQRAGEASPQYIRSPTAAERIAELQPAARMIVILREPASFLRSFHTQMVASHVESEKDFAKAIALEESRRRDAGDSFLPPQLLYSEHVRYVEQMQRLHASFPREQVMVIIYDDFRADNEATVRSVQRFLGVDDDLPITTVETKPISSVRSVYLHRLQRAVRRAEHDPQAAGPIARALTTLVPPRIRRGPLSTVFRRVTYVPQRPAHQELMLELRRRFKDEVAAIGEYLDRDLLTFWGYDKLP
jgi:Sulfotransferase family